MPNENVVKIRMDKPMFGVFFFPVSSIIWEDCLPLFSLASMSSSQLEAVLCDKGSYWKCECDEQVDCGPGSTKTVALSPSSAGKTCV